MVFTTNDAGHDAATVLAAAGVEIAAVIDVSEGGPASDAMRALGMDVRNGWAVTGTEGDARVSAVHAPVPVAPPRRRRRPAAGVRRMEPGSPAVARASAGGCGSTRDVRASLPDGGAPRGSRSWAAAAGDGLPTSAPYWFTPARRPVPTHFVDLQRDQTVADVLEAVGGGLRSVEHVKRATYIGTAIDQGRTSGRADRRDREPALGRGAGRAGPDERAAAVHARSPSRVLAGRDRGPVLLDPIRVTPIHDWHVEHGAVFENVGQWMRPWYFPRGGEIDGRGGGRASASRSANAVGVLDASTLGKIEVVGPDAAAFLDRMYTNAMSTLAVGSIRYGLMLRARRDGVRRRRRDAPGRGPLPRDDDDGRRGARARPVRGVAPDRMARPARVLHQRHRAVGDRRGGRAARAGA